MGLAVMFYYVTWLVCIWCQPLVNSMIFLKDMLLIWILVKWPRGELLSWILDCDLKWRLFFSDYTFFFCAPLALHIQFHFTMRTLRMMTTHTCEMFLTEVYTVIMHVKSEIRPAVMRKAAICFLKPFVLELALVSPAAIWEQCLCI